MSKISFNALCFVSLSAILGISLTGCGGTPTYTSDQMRVINFDQFFTSQKYTNEDGKIYAIKKQTVKPEPQETARNYTYNALEIFQKDQREISKVYCESQGGTFLSRVDFFREISPFNDHSNISQNAVVERMNAKLPFSYKEDAQVCTINQQPYFTFEYTTSYSPSGFVNQVYPEKNIIVVKRNTLEQIKSSSTPFFAGGEINTIQQIANEKQKLAEDEAKRKAQEIALSVAKEKEAKLAQQKRRDILQESCHRKNAEACTDLGVIYFQGNEIQADIKKAKTFFKQGCDLGNKYGCSNLDIATREEEEQKMSPHDRYFKKCDNRDASACSTLGSMYANGSDGVGKNLNTATKLFLRACQMGDGLGCNYYQLYHDKGFPYYNAEPSIMDEFRH